MLHHPCFDGAAGRERVRWQMACGGLITPVGVIACRLHTGGVRLVDNAVVRELRISERDIQRVARSRMAIT
jgi:hypothetical protein